MGKFDGSVVIVSGGARGMGASHVRGFAAEGARVVAGDVLDEDGALLAKEVGDAVTYVHLDVTRSQDWAAAVATASAMGPVKVLVNNAGVVSFGPLTAPDEAEFRRVIDINLLGVWLGMAAVVPAMKEAGGGTIVNISSTAGLQGYANISAYVASKWGVRGLTKAAALELGRDGIRVCSIHPGPIRTPMTAGMDGSGLTDAQPIPRFGEPEEVTAAVMFLASPEASFITGAEVAVDGGAVLGPLAPVGVD